MSKGKPILFFDKLEKKIVFNFSRYFFWFFTCLGGILIIVSILSLLYTLFPPSKEIVTKQTYPAQPIVYYEEILNEITPKKISKPQSISSTNKAKEVTSQVPQVKKVKSQLEILLDSLGTFFPNSWNGIYKNVVTGKDIFGRAKGYRKVFVGRGAKYIITNYRYFGNVYTKSETIKKLIKIMPLFKESQRIDALKTYLAMLKNKNNLYNRKVNAIDNEYRQDLALAESKYLKETIEKEVLEYRGMLGVGIGIVVISFLGLILGFLAIERNTRAIKNYIERGK